MAEVKKFQSAFKELIDLLFADFVRRKKGVQIKVPEVAAGHARWQELAEAARIDGAEFANLLEDHAVQRILKNMRIEEFADFAARSSFNQYRAQETQRISFQEWSLC